MDRPGIGAYGLLVLLALIWGGSFLFIKIAVADLPPLTLTAIRLALGALILLTLVKLSGQTLPANKTVWTVVALSAFFGNALPFTLINWGEEVIDSGLAAILMAGMPLFTLVCAHLVTDDEKMTGRKFAGVLLGLAGLVVLIGPHKLAELGDDTVRQLAVAAASICYGINAIVLRRAKGVSGKVLAAYVLAVSAVMVVPFALAFEQPWQLMPGGGAVAAAMVLGVAQTAIATLIMFALILGQGATFFSQINFLVPLVGVAYGMMFLAERPGANAFAALILILAGIALSRGRAGTVTPR